MGGVDQAPALVDLDRVEQQFDRPLAVSGEAVLDLARLLGDVDVHRLAAPGARRPIARSSSVTARSECGAMPMLPPGTRVSISRA